ncbi:MAG TPA: diaminobutyrate--2-oxoglutarate transaminase family protein [Hydrogenophaga sp.]|uniref:diaminobutyrate--2-oxoglutarate transaminase family protein n=1 Tax=Hydrogenophaga sp. TaxID=1904254 RepID=UPI002B57A539|nr:diaminobutyrate--2-oxoglutarate transaminase family protein [Hydrogenophaga sp.]HSX92668.1 diaminobutyrate--2-oxoglutarate transaminase family protein [Hydrogenophaga sp.]
MTPSATACSKGLKLIAERESSARTYARTFDRLFTRGSLSTVWDSEGRDYIDLLACAGALPLGHNHPYVMAAVGEFLGAGHLQQGLDLATPTKLAFVEQLLRTLPSAFARDCRLQFCGPTGADAVEAALKLFKTATGRHAVIAFHGAYHGMTAGAMGLMGNLGPKTPVPHASADAHFFPFPFPHARHCPFGVGGEEGETLGLRYLDRALGDPESGITPPALVMVEAIQGEGGCIPASARWLRGLREITARHNIPLVIDEVQTGFGRSGQMFAHEIAGIVPDAIVLSKALGGGFPLAVLAYHQRHDAWLPGAHAGTFRGNQIALAAGAATMRFLRNHDLPARAAASGERLRQGLRELADTFPCLGDIRGRGLMLGLEIVNARDGTLDGALARRLKRACFHQGVIVETGGRHGAVMRLLPALTISDADIDTAVRRIGEALRACVAEPEPAAA